MDLPEETYTRLMEVDQQAWLAEADLIEDFFAGFSRVPGALHAELAQLRSRIEQQ